MLILSTEGTVTEPQYFRCFNNDKTVLYVKVIKSKGSGPDKVLRKMQRFLQEQDLHKGDGAWLVVDKDNWTADQLTSLLQWSQEDLRYGLAVSNPMFEYWLLLHFEAAIRRGEKKDTGACTDLPHNTGTTVYRLVKNIEK